MYKKLLILPSIVNMEQNSYVVFLNQERPDYQIANKHGICEYALFFTIMLLFAGLENLHRMRAKLLKQPLSYREAYHFTKIFLHALFSLPK